MKNILAMAPFLFLLGCSNPADNVPAASVNPTTATARAATSDNSEPGSPAALSAAEGQVFAFGPGASKIEFVGSKVTGSHDGGFKEFTGEIRVVDNQVADSGIKVVIDMDSLWSDSDRLTGHLKNEDFFDVPKFPTATFTSTNVEMSSEDAMVTGDLTLHGVTQSISFPARIQVADDAVSLESEFSLNRFDFDIKYSGKSDDLIRKEVVIKLDINAAAGAAGLTAGEQAAPAP